MKDLVIIMYVENTRQYSDAAIVLPPPSLDGEGYPRIVKSPLRTLINTCIEYEACQVYSMFNVITLLF